MGLFPHLSRARIWMLRVTMLIRMIYWMWFSDAENRLSIGSLVQKIPIRRWKASRSVGRSVGRSTWENSHIQRKLARPSASLVISSATKLLSRILEILKIPQNFQNFRQFFFLFQNFPPQNQNFQKTGQYVRGQRLMNMCTKFQVDIFKNGWDMT